MTSFVATLRSHTRPSLSERLSALVLAPSGVVLMPTNARPRFKGLYNRQPGARNGALDLVEVRRATLERVNYRFRIIDEERVVERETFTKEECPVCGAQLLNEPSGNADVFKDVFVADKPGEREIVAYAFHRVTASDERTDGVTWACVPTPSGENRVDVFHIECALVTALCQFIKAERELRERLEIEVCANQKVRDMLNFAALDEDYLWSLLLNANASIPEGCRVANTADWFFRALDAFAQSTKITENERLSFVDARAKLESWLTSAAVAGDERRQQLRTRIMEARAAGELLRSEPPPVPKQLLRETIQAYDQSDHSDVYYIRRLIDSQRHPKTRADTLKYVFDLCVRLRVPDGRVLQGFSATEILRVVLAFDNPPTLRTDALRFGTSYTTIMNLDIVKHQKNSPENERIVIERIGVGDFTSFALFVPYTNITTSIVERVMMTDVSYVRALMNVVTPAQLPSVKQTIRTTWQTDPSSDRVAKVRDIRIMLAREYGMAPTVDDVVYLAESYVVDEETVVSLAQTRKWSVDDQLTIFDAASTAKLIEMLLFPQSGASLGDFPLNITTHATKVKQILSENAGYIAVSFFTSILDKDIALGNDGLPLSMYLIAVVCHEQVARAFPMAVALLDRFERVPALNSELALEYRKKTYKEHAYILNITWESILVQYGTSDHVRRWLALRLPTNALSLSDPLEKLTTFIDKHDAIDASAVVEAYDKMILLFNAGVRNIHDYFVDIADNYSTLIGTLPLTFFKLLIEVDNPNDALHIREYFFAGYVLVAKYAEAEEALGDNKTIRDGVVVELESQLPAGTITSNDIAFIFGPPHIVTPEVFERMLTVLVEANALTLVVPLVRAGASASLAMSKLLAKTDQARPAVLDAINAIVVQLLALGATTLTNESDLLRVPWLFQATLARAPGFIIPNRVRKHWIFRAMTSDDVKWLEYAKILLASPGEGLEPPVMARTVLQWIIFGNQTLRRYNEMRADVGMSVYVTDAVRTEIFVQSYKRGLEEVVQRLLDDGYDVSTLPQLTFNTSVPGSVRDRLSTLINQSTIANRVKRLRTKARI